MAARKSAFTRKREVACNAILDATSGIIAEKGVDGFTISEVALRAKINRALIYHYFGDRDNLVAQAINHILSRYQPAQPERGADGVERATRNHIEHPEVARFFFQMLLNGRPLPSLGQRTTNNIEVLERLHQERAPEAPFDATFVVIIIMLAQLSWAFSREEISRLLGLSVDEGDERFIAQLKRAIGQGVLAAGTPSD